MARRGGGRTALPALQARRRRPRRRRRACRARASRSRARRRRGAASGGRCVGRGSDRGVGGSSHAREGGAAALPRCSVLRGGVVRVPRRAVRSPRPPRGCADAASSRSVSRSARRERRRGSGAGPSPRSRRGRRAAANGTVGSSDAAAASVRSCIAESRAATDFMPGRRSGRPPHWPAAGRGRRRLRGREVPARDSVQQCERVAVGAERRCALEHRVHVDRARTRPTRSSTASPGRPPGRGRRGCRAHPVAVIVVSPRACEIPKSLIIAEPSSVMRMLPGFTSRCTIRSLWAAARAEPTCAPIRAASRGERVPCSRSRTDSGVDSINCITMQG